MDRSVRTDELAAVAAEAVRTGGDYLADQFRNGPVEAKYGIDDVKAVADREAEERILAVVENAFPDHAVLGEESGRRGDGEYLWVVDPLDGTNNFASGLPSFATAVCVLRNDEPVVAAVYEPLPDTLYLAERGHGATVNGCPLSPDGRTLSLAHGTVSFVRGLSAVRDPELDERSSAIVDALEEHCKRVVRTWSPCVDWGLVASGSFEGIVCFHPEVYEQHAGELLAAEAGVASAKRNCLYVGAGDEETLSELCEALPVNVD